MERRTTTATSLYATSRPNITAHSAIPITLNKHKPKLKTLHQYRGTHMPRMPRITQQCTRPCAQRLTSRALPPRSRFSRMRMTRWRSSWPSVKNASLRKWRSSGFSGKRQLEIGSTSSCRRSQRSLARSRWHLRTKPMSCARRTPGSSRRTWSSPNRMNASGKLHPGTCTRRRSWSRSASRSRR